MSTLPCVQLSLINTTIICIHPAPELEAVGSSRFHPPVSVLIALCIISPLVTAAVTLWVWALSHACCSSCLSSWLNKSAAGAADWRLGSCTAWHARHCWSCLPGPAVHNQTAWAMATLSSRLTAADHETAWCRGYGHCAPGPCSL